MIWFDLGCVYLVELPLGWHTDTYRMVSIGHGAFELCLPSLGILYQIYLLRTQYLGVGHRPGWSWGEDLRSMDRVTLSHACRISGRSHPTLPGSLTYGSILTNSSGVFGLISPGGNSW